MSRGSLRCHGPWSCRHSGGERAGRLGLSPGDAVTPGPAPPAALRVPASTWPSLLTRPGFNPQSLWRGWREHVVSLL